MAVAKLNKLFIVTHKSDTEALLKKLQKSQIAIELKPYTEKLDLEIPPSDATPEYNSRVKEALDILDDPAEKKLKKFVSKAGKMIVRKAEYENILKGKNFEGIVENILNFREEIENLDTKIKDSEQKINKLSFWSCFKGYLEDIASGDIYTIKLGILRYEKNNFIDVIKKLNENNISYEKLTEEKDTSCVILAYHNQFKKNAEEYLAGISFEESDITGYRGTIVENLEKIQKGIELDKNRKKLLRLEINKISGEYKKPLTVYLDYIENNLEIEKALESGFSTDSVSFYTAWVKESDKKKIISIIEDFKVARVVEIKPYKDENIPVILENRPLFRPFEMVVELYGVPRYFEIDPTPFVSLFFALFFALCLTDAGYGIILAILTLIFAFKKRNIKNFLILIFIGAIFTVFTGALFSGWFGDLPSYIGVGGFFEKLAILGDPIKTYDGAMNFFRLALALGVIHIIFGLSIKFFDCLKRRDWGGAFLDGLPWIVIILSIVIILLSTQVAVNLSLITRPLFPAGISKILIWPALAAAVVVMLFGARSEKNWGLRIFIGFLNLTILGGITSYLGDFLSYIRLMALGMTTAGIAIAINRIAFQFLSTPVVGIIMLLVILIFGHIANMAINVMGAFIHTLRLQYVEFFQKFYVGGGRPFEALKDEHKYITIVD